MTVHYQIRKSTLAQYCKLQILYQLIIFLKVCSSVKFDQMHGSEGLTFEEVANG